MQGAGEFVQNLGGVQHAAALLGMSQNNGVLAEGLAGMGMSRGMAAGRPMMSGLMGMMGLDPFSMGLRAATGAWGRGAGLMGAGMAGLAVAAPMAIGGQIAGYAGDQMMVGAQQQMQLNQSLRRNFNFMNPSGGTGFSPSQGFEIGSHMRGMTHDMGPGGEMTTFGELTRLAGNMGRMGMAQDVRSVKDFKEKFKQMVDTLKTVAQDMGSSLEEAQKFVQSMKGSGIFNKADQLKMSQGTRMTAMAGNMAMSEVTGMANIGSQISRSVGGLGRSGAFAGMNAIGQVGIAQQLGAINEEDIYNATGLTGAEGRQALATSQLQRSASFLSTGRGRRFLASVASRNGTLDEGSVAEWMGGGMTTGQTMENAYSNLGKVGRANFIRNEGRLRGAALEKFGGMLQSMAYSQWLGSRGYDPHNMDDTSMLAFQRFSGMGRDEADVAIKQVQALPDIMRERQETERMAGYSDAVSQRDKMTGISGLKRRLEHSREGIQSKLQQAGSRILQAGQGMLESWFNKTLGVYEAQASEGLVEIEKALSMGGAGSAANYRRTFGGAFKGMQQGGGLGGTITDLRERQENQRLQFAAMGGSQDKSVHDFGNKYSDMVHEATLGGAGQGSMGTLESFRDRLSEMSKLGGSKGSDAKALLDKMGFRDLSQYQTPSSINEMMMHGDAASIRRLGGNRAQQVAMIQSMQERAGVIGGSQISGQLRSDAGEMFLGGGGMWATNEDKLRVLGSMMTTGKRPSSYDSDEQVPWWKKALAVGGAALTGVGAPLAVAGAAIGGIHGLIKGAQGENAWEGNIFNRAISGAVRFGERATEELSGLGQSQRAFARTILEDESVRGAISDLGSGDKDLQGSAKQTLYRNLQATRGQKRWGDMTADEQGRTAAMSSALIGSEFSGLLGRMNEGRTAVGDTEQGMQMIKRYQALSGKFSMSDFRGGSDVMQQLMNYSKFSGAARGQQDFINLQKSLERTGAGIQSDQARATRMGLLGEGDTMSIMGMDINLGTRRKREAMAGLDESGRAAFETGLSLSQFDITRGSAKDLADTLAEQGIDSTRFEGMDESQKQAIRAMSGHKEYFRRKGELTQNIGQMSLAQKQKLAKAGAGTMIGDIAGAEIATERKFTSLTKATGSEMGALSKMLGVDMSEDELGFLKSMGTDSGTQFVLEKAGLGKSEALKKGLMEAFGQKSMGGKATALKGAIANMSAGDRQILQDKAAAAQDPSFREMKQMRENTDKMVKALDTIASKNPEASNAENAPNKQPVSPAK